MCGRSATVTSRSCNGMDTPRKRSRRWAATSWKRLRNSRRKSRGGFRTPCSLAGSSCSNAKPSRRAGCTTTPFSRCNGGSTCSACRSSRCRFAFRRPLVPVFRRRWRDGTLKTETENERLDMNATTILFGAVTSDVLAAAVVLLILFAAIWPFVLGIVLIHERQVGIVVKKIGTRSLAPGRLVALDGEAGYQAATLAPGLHFRYWRWQYRIIKVPVTVVPQGEIALVLAADGAAIPAERILGKIVDCDNFQDARKFLVNGGEKGRQLGILTAGTYRINTALFTVITSVLAPEHGMAPEQLLLQ